jgi:hypothetical protein
MGMSENQKSDPNMRDANLAAEQRPIPSQAEGDLETVEEDLKQKEQSRSQGAGSGGQK